VADYDQNHLSMTLKGRYTVDYSHSLSHTCSLYNQHTHTS